MQAHGRVVAVVAVDAVLVLAVSGLALVALALAEEI
jgi:hypothetical protein